MFIETPYGRKTPELLCRAMDCLVVVEQLVPLLKNAGVFNLFVAPEGSHHRKLCSAEQKELSDLLSKLSEIAKENKHEPV